MKRIISVLLTLCMVCGLVPITGVSALDDGIRIVYDYAAQMPAGTVYFSNYGEEQLKAFSFESSHELWAYAGYYGGDVRFRNRKIIQLEKNGYWYATEIYVPESGIYTVEQEYSTYTGSGTLDVYIIPKGDTEKYDSTLITNKNPLISQSCVGEDNFMPAQNPARAENVELDAGYHYVVYKANGGRAMFGNLTLNGGEGKSFVDFDIIRPEYIIDGEKGAISVVGYYSDATSAEYIGDMFCESSNVNVISINENTGEYEAVSGGTAIVTVTVNGIEKETVFNVRGKSGITVKYDYAAQMPGGSVQSYNYDMSLFSYESTGGLWAYEGCYGGDIRFRNGKIVQLEKNSYWYTTEIYVPKSGIYTIEQVYSTYPGSGTLDVYMIPKGESTSYSATLISGKTPLLSQGCDGADGYFTPLETPAKKEKVLLDEGYYYVVYKANGGRAMFGNLTLNGGEGRELATISFDIPNIMVKGDGGVIAPVGTMSDATVSPKKDGYAFSSDNEAVISIDPVTGEYTAVGKGKATITVTYDIGRKKVTAQRDVEIIEGSAAERRLEYAFSESIPVRGDGKHFSELCDEKEDGAYQFAGASRDSAGDEIQYCDKFMILEANEWFAFEIDVPVSGIYALNQKYGKNGKNTGSLELYIIPKGDSENFEIDSADGLEATGKQRCFESGVADYTENAQPADFGVSFLKAGKYYAVYRATGGCAMFGNLILDGRNTFKKIMVSAPESIEVGKSSKIDIAAKTLDMSLVDLSAVDIGCSVSAPKTLSVEIGDNNECTVYGENEGKTWITISAQCDENSDSATFEIEVIDNSAVEKIEIDVSDYIYVRDTESIKLLAHMGSGRVIEIDDALYEVAEATTDNIATISGNSITANAEGKMTLKASGEFKGEIRVATKEIEFLEGMSKQEPTYYTYEMRENAEKNSEKYAWAREEVKKSKESAEEKLGHLDTYYEMIIGEGLPRSRNIKGKGHPEIEECMYCGEIISGVGWGMLPFSRAWKVQCPECKRLFPSNDFESFLKLGLDKQGYFDIDRARKEHHKMLFHKDEDECTCEVPAEAYSEEWYTFYGYGNEDGYLYNELYEEVGSENSAVKLLPGETVGRWCVDDGFGYLTGKIFNEETSTKSDDIVERYCPVALYNYLLLNSTAVSATSDFGEAYVLTGEEKYGVAGAILLDRIADVLPSYDTDTFDTDAYQISDGGTGQGKIQGYIQDSYILKGIARNADRLFPVLKDTEACKKVINYLNSKAEVMGLENKKSSAEDIWRNWEENILIEIFKAAKLAKIGGNFGTYQSCVATAALVLDKQPESDEMFDWLFKSGGLVYPQNSETGDYYYSGGNIGAQLVDVVDRDGFGSESSASYNCMWWEQLVEFAEITAKYGNEKYDLYKNVKFLKMLEAFADLVMVNSHTVHIGDCSSGTASVTFVGNVKQLVNAFEYIKDKPVAEQIANYIALYYGYKLDDLRDSIYSENPEGLGEEIMNFVTDEDGITKSKMLGGYGFAALRAGMKYGKDGMLTDVNNQRDFWIYFGGALSHRHSDALNLGIEAYGLNMAPDLAYPTDATVNAERSQWTSATLSHNTVMVDGKNQKGLTLPGKPLHFDDSGKVKVMDASVPEVYDSTSEYRRTVVMIEVDDDVSYGVDFFRVDGGDEHIYSFHTQTDEDATVNGMTLIPQVDEPQSNWSPEDTSSYAGADIKYGPDPNPVTEYNYVTYYPRGTTWLRDVRRANDAGNEFTADFKINDYNKAIRDNKDLHLSLTMVNDFELDEVAFAKGKVPTRTTNKNLPTHLEYMLAKRSGKNLDSLFTTVYQPYRNEEYISSIEQIVPTKISGTETKDDVVKAVKITHKNGRVDYVIYATNGEVVYQLENNADMTFRGFVGVWSTNAAGAVTYSYILGGESDITGKISDFTEDLSLQNYIDIKPDKEVSPEDLAGKYIFVEHDGVGNAAYEILSAGKKENGDIRLDIGTVTTVRKYTDAEDFDAGYIFNIAKKQKFVISVPEITDASPVFEVYDNGTVSANSTYKQKLTATSPLDGVGIEFIGRTLPRGASINAETGVFTWKPDTSQIGENHIAVTARDSDGRETTAHFIVTVYGSTTGSSSDNNTSTENSGTSGEGTASGGGGGGGDAPTDTPDADDESLLPEEKVPSTGEADEAENGDTDNIRFIDLGNHAWAADSINSLADDGIVKGTTENTYSPANNITRADFALLLVRAFKLESDNAENFADVSVSDYFASELAIARNTGIVNGIGDNKYAPRNTITRQDMIVIVYRALETLGKLPSPQGGEGPLAVDEVLSQYPDYSTVAPYARDAVSALIGAGLVNGKSGYIAPNEYTTRAEVAVLIKRIIDFKGR